MDSYIFGNKAPKFKDGSTTVNLDYSYIEQPEILSREIEHESKINAHREWSQVSNYYLVNISIVVRLHKYYGAAAAKFNEIIAFLHTDIDQLYPSRDREPLKNSSGSNVAFHFTDFELYGLETPYAYDTLRLYFKSKDPVDLTQLLSQEILDGLDSAITDDLGDTVLDGI